MTSTGSPSAATDTDVIVATTTTATTMPDPPMLDLPDSKDEPETEEDVEEVEEKKEEAPKEKKKRRFHPGTCALREIRKQQKCTNTAIPRAAFARFARDIGASVSTNNDLRWTSEAIEALQAASEDMLIKRFQFAQLASIHANREGVTVDDLRLAVYAASPSTH